MSFSAQDCSTKLQLEKLPPSSALSVIGHKYRVLLEGGQRATHAEWAQLSPLLANTIEKIKKCRAEHRCDIPTARVNCSPEAVAMFEELTGYKNIAYDVMFYFRRSNYGPKCKNCGKLFRTQKAKMCAACGRTVEKNN